jgi:hypothetical protein
MRPDDEMRAARSLGNRVPAPVYSRALLCYDDRVALDGATAEPLEAKAKGMAAKKPAPAPAPPTETPRKTPEQFRDRVRASLLRRSV